MNSFLDNLEEVNISTNTENKTFTITAKVRTETGLSTYKPKGDEVFTMGDDVYKISLLVIEDSD